MARETAADALDHRSVLQAIRRQRAVGAHGVGTLRSGARRIAARWLEQRKDTLTAWLSTLILLSTFGFLRVCRVGETDVLLSLGCCIALIGLTRLDERPEDRTSGWYLFWAGFAIALMTKGAASVVIPLTALSFAAMQRWRLDRFGRRFWLGLLLFALLVLPWHLEMVHLFGRRFLDEYLGLHVLSRATSQIEGHTSPWVVLLPGSAGFGGSICRAVSGGALRSVGAARSFAHG